MTTLIARPPKGVFRTCLVLEAEEVEGLAPVLALEQVGPEQEQEQVLEQGQPPGLARPISQREPSWVTCSLYSVISSAPHAETLESELALETR